jgi:pyrroline-5-carboxylate reductase
MLAAGDSSAAELRARVTSPGGTTAAALAAIEDGGMDRLVSAAVQAAIARGRELGEAT